MKQNIIHIFNLLVTQISGQLRIPGSREGGCICGRVRYHVASEPLIVHYCHCHDCQNNSGTSFALNALFEADRVELISGDVENLTVPTPSGTGQIITRCSKCKIREFSGNSNRLQSGIRDILGIQTIGIPIKSLAKSPIRSSLGNIETVRTSISNQHVITPTSSCVYLWQAIYQGA